MNKYEMKEEVVYTAKIRNEEGLYMPVLVYREGSKIKEYYTGQTLCTIIHKRIDITKMLEKKHRLVFYRDKYVDENGQTRYRLLQANIGVINTYKEQARKGKNLFIKKLLLTQKTGNEPETRREESKMPEISKLKKSKLRLIRKIHTIYEVPIRIINPERSIEEFKRPIPEFKKTYTMLPGKECSVKKNLSLFEYTKIKGSILVYQSLNGTYKELITGISITCIKKDESKPDNIYVYEGKSESAHIRQEEFDEATEEEIQEYLNQPTKKMENFLSETIKKAQAAYQKVMETIKDKQQQKRKIQNSGGFING